MARTSKISTLVTALVLSSICAGQSPLSTQVVAGARPGKRPVADHLTVAQRIVISSETAVPLEKPQKCDGEGNLYLQSEHGGAFGIRKVSSKGKILTTFRAATTAEFGEIDYVGDFAVAPNGDVYELVFPHEVNRYVFVYASDGSFRSAIKLEAGFPWVPTTLGLFPSGDLLVAGLRRGVNSEKKPVSWPFTGVFSRDGRLVREVKFEDDPMIDSMAASRDSRVVSLSNPFSNHAVEYGQAETATDGYVYLMRWLSPAILYAVSPGGDVVRRFTVDPGDPDYRPMAMHLSSNRLAILFFHLQTKEERMTIVDLHGREVAAYRGFASQDNQPSVESMLAFACFTAQPEVFTGLWTTDSNNLEILVAKPE